ncbi:MAG TPA: type I-C CRISPR-associated endonuclease Cas1c [Dehalococcoidia bacterium]|jgi:CRISPR-associated protein Cas1|nr:type I-C CRISPR-associated endonuclease Cas1c [Dehalococcoidia bacterium]
MARELLNTLYVTTQGSYVHVDHQTLKVELDGNTRLQVPVHHLGSVVCFGRVMVSPAAIAQCAQDHRDLVFLSESGRFIARMLGATSGNVLLRLSQHKAYQDQTAALDIARNIVAAKLQNSRLVLLREARQTLDPEAEERLRTASDRMASIIKALPKCKTLDEARGSEGEAAAIYFSVFKHLIRVETDNFTFTGRNRRPPRDPVNALLSFLYALLRSDYEGAIEGVGLDPQIGFLHAVRPGRPSLALDLMEELRPLVADRLVLTLINRRQLTAKDFTERPGGGILLSDDGRRTLLTAYQKRKSEEVYHPVVDRNMPIGLIPHLQARLLARHLRSDLEHYPPFVGR